MKVQSPCAQDSVLALLSQAIYSHIITHMFDVRWLQFADWQGKWSAFAMTAGWASGVLLP